MRLAFGPFTLDVDRRELYHQDRVQPLEPKAFMVLAYLLTHRDRAISKEELLETCWPGEFVTESALTRCVRLIRQAVADDGRQQQVIKTLRGYGYRCVAVVDALPAPPAAALLLRQEVPVAVTTGVGLSPVVLPVAGLSDPIAPLSCPQCQTANRATRQFCAACGQALWQPCPQCGFHNSATERFCGGCGHEGSSLVVVATAARLGPPQAYTPAPLARKILASHAEAAGERKMATVLVVGIGGLQTLRQRTEPDTMEDLVNRGFALLVAEVHRVEGFVSQVARYGFTALFGALLACEDHIVRALHAALGIQRAFAAYAAALHQNYGVLLALRLGVHTGPVVVNALSADLHLAYTAPGATLEVATGLQQQAPVDTIWVSAAIQQQAVGFFHFTAVGAHPFPEVDEVVHIYTCDGIGSVTSRLEGTLARGRTAFHGGAQELALLEAYWARVCQGTGQVVCLVGEAGIGKSRLADECQQHLGTAHLLTAQALSYGQAMPYHALLPLLRTVLGMAATKTPSQQRQAIRTHLAAIDPALMADTPLLAQMQGVPLEAEALPALTPDAQRRRLQHACLQVLLQQATNAPLCLLVEDGHWFDPSSHELLDLLVAALARRPILVLCTARPGFRHTWADYTYFHQVAVEPLMAPEIDAMLRDLLQPYEAAPALTAWFRARTGGNPLFVEELVRTMQTQGLLVLQGERYEMPETSRVTLPVSIQGIVQARLDQLPAAEKFLLQEAAVIGPEVPLPVMQALVDHTAEGLQRGLWHLQAVELLYEIRAVPHPTYTFKHALVQDAAYQSLLRTTRQQLHQQVAQVLEAQFPELVETQPALLAQHYTAAHLPAQAIPYWQQAGHRAIARSANIEAIQHLTKGLEVLATLPETPERTQHELTLSITLAAPLLMTKGYATPDVERVYNRVQQVCRQLGDTPQVFPALYGLSAFYLVRGECHTARQFGRQALLLAQQVQAPDLLVLAYTILGVALFFCGALTASLEHLEQGWSRYDPVQHHALAFRYGDDPGVFSLAYMTMILWLLGYPDQAQERSTAAVVLARQLGHPFSCAIPLGTTAVLSQFRWEETSTQAWAEALIALSTEQGFAHWLGAGMMLRAWACARQGHSQEGVAHLRQGLAAWRATGARLLEPYWLALLAETSWWTGQLDEGLHTVAAALGVSAHNREPWWDAHLYWLKGELLLAQPSTPHMTHDIEACFHRALAVARRQQAKSLELRAATSLARLWQRQGKRAAAYELLAPVYDWFTEGFDTTDLQEARALIEELG